MLVSGSEDSAGIVLSGSVFSVASLSGVPEGSVCSGDAETCEELEGASSSVDGILPQAARERDSVRAKINARILFMVCPFFQNILFV